MTCAPPGESYPTGSDLKLQPRTGPSEEWPAAERSLLHAPGARLTHPRSPDEVGPKLWAARLHAHRCPRHDGSPLFRTKRRQGGLPIWKCALKACHFEACFDSDDKLLWYRDPDLPLWFGGGGLLE